MKNFKIVFATLLMAALGIAVSSFTVKAYNKKAFSTVCYLKHQDGSYSSDASAVPPTSCDDGSVYCGFCYDDTQTNFTLAQAEALADANSTSSHGTTVTDANGKQVTVYRRSTPQPL